MIVLKLTKGERDVMFVALRFLNADLAKRLKDTRRSGALCSVIRSTNGVRSRAYNKLLRTYPKLAIRV